MSFQTQQTYLFHIYGENRNLQRLFFLVCTNTPMNGTGRHKTSEEHKRIKTTSGEIYHIRRHYGNRWCECAESQWFKNKGGDEVCFLATFRRHWGDTNVGTRVGKNAAMCLWKTKKQHTGFKNKLEKTHQLCMYMYWWPTMSLGQMLTGRGRVCGRLSGSVVGDHYGSEKEPKEGASLGRWTDQLIGSVSSVEIHSAGAQAPALPEVTASSSLKRVITGFVQVIQGSSSLHVGAARFRRSVALQFLHQQLTAAT